MIRSFAPQKCVWRQPTTSPISSRLHGPLSAVPRDTIIFPHCGQLLTLLPWSVEISAAQIPLSPLLQTPLGVLIAKPPLDVKKGTTNRGSPHDKYIRKAI